MTENAILIQNLVKQYNQKYSSSINSLALDDFNLAVPRGSIFGLLGPNGAGKSTLINILAGTVVKTSGEVRIMGTSIDEFPKKARSSIGIVPQEVSFDTFFPIYQALEFYAGYYGIKPNQRKTEEILRALSLWDKKDSFPQRLSGGMKRRFLIAKAMVHSPAVLILDEPTAGVDLELRLQLWEYVKTLNKQGMTIIITTHYLAEAQELCDEIAFINKGKIIKQDKKSKLLQDLGTRHIDVEFSTHVDLTALEFAKGSVEILSANKLRFQVNTTGDNYSKILQNINKVGGEIKDLRISQPDLEVIFHQIMQE
ncbi:ABC transporter ATP-binding protein [Candidatus Megaera venefica]|uniref:ABC transporter ATP-binding protein n=1 Tax=Candidatus Megaera venefica TaxID=2055910 RepID=A0ABU5NDW1_9RICK|nr:ABC transporter ATP-binding protein [Candidatus Megaera venefica]MEA0971372.1 ABC transporter ATP-binding protein [Candidatus Megaera venefica]